MTTRDPRHRASGRTDSGQGQGRDPTQSLSLGPDDEIDSSHPSLALGTHEAGEGRENRTKIDSPQGRTRTPAPPRPATRPPPVPRNVDDPDNRIGSHLGNYKVLELLGKGGMGYVYRAEHVKLGREVALKLLRSDYAKRKDAVSRFVQEARTVNRVRHRNIVDVPDILELEDGTTCIVMEFLRGHSLGKWARSGVDLPRALAVLVQICDGLSAAHAVSVVHRDLKPDNIIVVPTSDGAELVKLLDFGVAKLLNRDDEDVGFQTAAGSVIGTPAYMSPEQAGGMAVDARSDIYSLGAIMYELFCGQPMFRGRSFGEYVRKHLTELPPRPRATDGGAMIDERLEAVILKAIEKDPNQRYGHILELRDALLSLLGGLETHPPGFAQLTASGIRPPPLPPLPTMPPTMHAPTPVSGGHPSLHHSSGHFSANQSAGFAPYVNYSQIVGLAQPPVVQTPWWVWFVGGAVAVGLGIGAAVWYAGRDEPGPPVAQALTTPPVGAQPTPPTQPSGTPEPALDPVKAPAKPFEVRFDSLPSGGVFADGRSAELCRTPCSFNIDPADPGAPDKRTYIVKAEGYKDGVVVVDVAAPRREFSVTLEQLVAQPPQPTDPIALDKKPLRPTGKKPGATTTTKPTTSAGDSKPPDDKPGDPDTLLDPTDGKPIDPSTKKPEIKKPGDKIDRSDTLDPFRRKRP